MQAACLIKVGNTLYLTGGDRQGPPPFWALQVVPMLLSYEHKKFLYGYQARDKVTGVRRRVDIRQRQMFYADDCGRIVTRFGFAERLYNALAVAAQQLPTPAPVQFFDYDSQLASQRPDRYEQSWENVTRNFEFRPKQRECLDKLAASYHGLVHAPTGFGKMVMLTMHVLLFYKAICHVVTDRGPLVNKLVEFLTKYIPNVGQVGAGQRRLGERVTVFSADSLHHSDGEADFLLVDEGHEAGAEKYAAHLMRYHRSRNFTFTASPSGRMDGTDLRVEAIFGPSIFTLPYWEAVDLGLVVPIQVQWQNVILSYDPSVNVKDDIERRRLGIWFNSARNDIIAADVCSEPEDEQFLVLTDTVYHAIELYKRIRQKRSCTLVYDKIDFQRFEKYRSGGDLPENEPPMTFQRKEFLRREFEAGRGNYIATPTWSVGIDPTELQHLYMAAPWSSEIRCTQAPGRVSRKPRFGDKCTGVVHDYRDQFSKSFRAAARRRFEIYRSYRWDQVLRYGAGLQPLAG